MAKVRGRYTKCTNVITVKFGTAEKIQDLNSEAVASAIREHEVLNSIMTCLDIHDSIDSVIGNEPLIEQAKKLIEKAREHNNYQLDKDQAEMKLLDNVVDMFPEHVSRLA